MCWLQLIIVVHGIHGLLTELYHGWLCAADHYVRHGHGHVARRTFLCVPGDPLL